MATADVRILGHRGSPRQARENTVESFRIALLEGADGFETDLRRLADGTIAVFHDAAIDGVPIATMTIDSIRARVPDLATLDDLATFSQRCTIVLEIKESGFEPEILERVRGWNPEGRLILSSFRRQVIARLARLGSPFDLGLVTDEPMDDPLLALREHSARWFFPHESLVTADLVGHLRTADIGVIPWTVNLQTMWGKLAEIGCNGWITDRPAESIQWRAAHTSG